MSEFEEQCKVEDSKRISIPVVSSTDKYFLLNRLCRLSYKFLLRDQGDGNAFVQSLVQQHPQRIIQFYWLNPRELEIVADYASDLTNIYYDISGGAVISPERLEYALETFGADVVTACQQYLSALIAIVYECYILLGNYVDSHQYYSESAFASRSLTIEDAEEEVVGFRGWTEAPDISVSERWQMIRESVAPFNTVCSRPACGGG